jgi:beta-N-acetylhexosaminidase
VLPVRSRRLLPICCALALGLAGCSSSQHRFAAHRHPAPLRRLTLAQLAGQRIVYAYNGLTPPASLLAVIRRGEAAGVIFFSQNIASVAQLRAVTRRLQHAAAGAPVHAPLLLMTDQEGGLVRRLPGAPAMSEKEIGASADPAASAREAGAAAARELKAAGLNVNLAPVLDVYRQAGNFIDEFQRSYASSASLVAEAASSFIAAQQRAGVAATAKHFPGLGAAQASQNTDERPVTLDAPAAEIRATDEAPYRAAIASGVDLVMLSWARYPALDQTHPAGLSPVIVQRELRSDLHFRGVTITDSLGAGALAGDGGPDVRGELAASAGADLILCSARLAEDDNPSVGIEALDGIAAALRTHRLDRGAAEAAAERVIALRLRVG